MKVNHLSAQNLFTIYNFFTNNLLFFDFVNCQDESGFKLGYSICRYDLCEYRELQWFQLKCTPSERACTPN